MPATAGKRDDKGKWTWEESGGFEIDEACLPPYPTVSWLLASSRPSTLRPSTPSFFDDCRQIDEKIGRRVLPVVNPSWRRAGHRRDVSDTIVLEATALSSNLADKSRNFPPLAAATVDL